jgi:hypothetical protein
VDPGLRKRNCGSWIAERHGGYKAALEIKRKMGVIHMFFKLFRWKRMSISEYVDNYTTAPKYGRYTCILDTVVVATILPSMDLSPYN